MTEEIKAVLGNKFIVYDNDNKPIAKGWIMDAKEVIEDVDVTSIYDKQTVYAKSTKTVITGDITHYPL